jgi:hypothetical protein
LAKLPDFGVRGRPDSSLAGKLAPRREQRGASLRSHGRPRRLVAARLIEVSRVVGHGEVSFRRL